MRSTVTLNADLDYAVFVKKIAKKTGVDLASYKRKQMERRLRSLAQRYGARGLREFYDLLERDPEVLEQFRKRMTINVSELFRNPDKFQQLEREILPRLLAETGRPGRRRLKVWSAGCSYGAEAYSVAILARELAGPGEEVSILGTDIDEEMLSRAREGVFSEADMKNVSPVRRRFFVRTEGWYRVGPELRGMVRFRHHDLLNDDFAAGFHLILCRNVVIYFTEEAKDHLYRRLFKSLASGGVLFIGSTERIFEAAQVGFETASAFFYRKPGPAGTPAAGSGE